MFGLDLCAVVALSLRMPLHVFPAVPLVRAFGILVGAYLE